MGGDGDDVFEVRANQAPVDITGDDGNDRVTLTGFRRPTARRSPSRRSPRSPALASTRSGVDGTELADTFTVLADVLVGAGLEIIYTGFEHASFDGREGDDELRVIATAATTVTSVAGGAGSDTIGVAADTAGPLIVDGGTIVAHLLERAFRLPTETDSLLPILRGRCGRQGHAAPLPRR